MAENLKHPERESESENHERKEKINQIYAMLNNVGMDLEKVCKKKRKENKSIIDTKIFIS